MTREKIVHGKPEIVTTYHYKTVPKVEYHTKIVHHTKYFDENGKEITDPKVIARFAKMGAIVDNSNKH